MLFAIAKITSASDRNFLDLLYRTHSGMLYRTAYSIVRDRDAANDILTSTMLSMFSLVSKLRSMDEQGRIAYLRKATRHNAYKYYKSHSQENLTIGLEDILFSIPEREADPAEILIQDEDFRAVREAIATLPERDRRLLYLKYAVGLSAREIAELTDAPSAAAVHERLSRARRRVLTQLEERGWSDEKQPEHPGASGAVRGPAIPTDH